MTSFIVIQDDVFPPMGCQCRLVEFIIKYSFIFTVALVSSFDPTSLFPLFLIETILGDPHIDISQIPDIVLGDDLRILNHVMQNPQFCCLWDSYSTRKCFAQKRMLFLGDSTMEETIDDIVILLSGIGSNRTRMEDYLFQSSLSSHVHPPYKKIELPGNVTVEYFGGRRNVTVTSNKLDLHLRYRFTGHHNMFRNFEGILTFFQEDFSTELDCLLGHGGLHCVQPTTVVVNSGLHDARGHNNATTFAFYLNKLFERFNSTITPPPRVVWKANILSSDLKRFETLPQFDLHAYQLARQWGAEYVNTTVAYDAVSRSAPELLGKTSTDEFLHIGSIAKDKFHREKRHRKSYSWHSLAMSSLATQLLLHAICR